MLDQAADRGFRPTTLGADKLYDVREFFADLRGRGLTPHVAQNTSRRRSAVDGRTTRHPGYAVSQTVRRRCEEIWGWMKTVGAFRRTRYRGVARTALAAYLVGAAYNLVRIANLLRPVPLAATAWPPERRASDAHGHARPPSRRPPHRPTPGR